MTAAEPWREVVRDLTAIVRDITHRCACEGAPYGACPGCDHYRALLARAEALLTAEPVASATEPVPSTVPCDRCGSDKDVDQYRDWYGANNALCVPCQRQLGVGPRHTRLAIMERKRDAALAERDIAVRASKKWLAEVERLRVAEGEAMLVVEAQETNMKRLEAELATARRDALRCAAEQMRQVLAAMQFKLPRVAQDVLDRLADRIERGPAKE